MGLEREGTKMNANKALKRILENSPLRVGELNEKLNYESKHVASTVLGRNRISYENLLKFSDVLKYDVVLVPRGSRTYLDNEYVLTNEEMDAKALKNTKKMFPDERNSDSE